MYLMCYFRVVNLTITKEHNILNCNIKEQFTTGVMVLALLPVNLAARARLPPVKTIWTLNSFYLYQLGGTLPSSIVIFTFTYDTKQVI